MVRSRASQRTGVGTRLLCKGSACRGDDVTEAEWLAATNPTPLLMFLRGRISERKLRLFGCACCRRVWHRIAVDESKAAVQLAERFADGEASLEQALQQRNS